MHRKFALLPIVSLDASLKVNLEDFECLELQFFAFSDGVNIIPIEAPVPYEDFTVRLDGNIITIDCDIPHQFAPEGWDNGLLKHSQIKQPIFPINYGQFIFLRDYSRASISLKT